MCVCTCVSLKVFHLITLLKLVKMILDLKGTLQNLQQIRHIQSRGCDFTLTAAFAAELLSSAYQRTPPNPLLSPSQTHTHTPTPTPSIRLAPGICRDAGGLAGSAAVSIISVTCPARRPAALPVIRLGFILGAENTRSESAWLAADRSASLSASRPTTQSPTQPPLVPSCHSVKAKAG